MSKMILRDYQQEALDCVDQSYLKGIKRQLIVLPTGSGKTIIFAAIAKRLNKKTLIIAHREELIIQARKKLLSFWPTADIGICKGETKELGHQITIGSVQTCCRDTCLDYFKSQGIDLLIIDEAHHATASSYQKIVRGIGFGTDKLRFYDGDKLLIGVTATPARADKITLKTTFDEIIYKKSVAELIKGNYLAPVIGRRLLTSFNLDGVKTSMGDFAVGELATAVNTTARNNFIVNNYKKYAIDRKAIAFCADVTHCHSLAEVFNSQGVKAEAIWGNMDVNARRKVIARIKKGTIKVACSCGVLTEGFDEPSLGAIIMARPTKSKGLYIQMAGRGLRTHPGKENCLILDFTDKYHTLRTIVTLKDVIPEAKIEEDKPMHTGGLPRFGRPTIDTLKDIDETFDLIGDTLAYKWLDIGDGELSLPDNDGNEFLIKPVDGEFMAAICFEGIITPLLGGGRYKLDHCIKKCELLAKSKWQRKDSDTEFVLNMSFSELDSNWVKYSGDIPATDKQKSALERNDAYIEGMSKIDAHFALNTIFACNRKAARMKKFK